MMPYLITLVPELNKHIEKNDKILIHCRAGMQRSATIVAGIMINKHQMSAYNAIKFIQDKRKIAFRPFPHFNLALNFYEKYMLQKI